MAFKLFISTCKLRGRIHERFIEGPALSMPFLAALLVPKLLNCQLAVFPNLHVIILLSNPKAVVSTFNAHFHI